VHGNYRPAAWRKGCRPAAQGGAARQPARGSARLAQSFAGTRRTLKLVFLPDVAPRSMIPTTNDSSFHVSTDRTRLDVPMIYRFLSENSTWAVGISRDVVERAIENSLCFGGYLDGRQIAFARVITDYATMAHLADVFVIRACRACVASR
jgi:hypothetical protein